MGTGSSMSSPPAILIVDDDPDIREALSDRLEFEGYGVQAVGRGGEAIEKVRQERFGAVLLDIELPDLDGLSVLKVLTDLDPKLPIIVLTGHISEENTVGSLMKGAFAYMTKPYNLDEVKATLRRAVDVKALAVKAERVESALYDSEERFRSVVESATDAIVLADGGGNIISWNRSAQRLFAYTEEEVIGKPLTLLMPARYRDAHQRGLERVRSTGQSRLIGKSVELHGRRKDGGEFPLELSLGTWTTEEGTFYSGIIRDITERKRNEERLAKINECLLRFGQDSHENITRLTALCGELLGGTCAVYSRLEGTMLRSIGRWRTSPNYPEVGEAEGHLCHDVIKGGGDQVMVVRHLPDTPYAQTDPSVIPYKLQTYVGQAVRRYRAYVGSLCVVYQKDFVPTKEDHRLMGIIASAIGVEEERMHAQDQLIQAEKLASLGTLVSGMAHEINNPVQGILGMAEVIAGEQNLEKIQEYAQDIVNFSKHIATVVRDFSCYARPASRDDESEIDLNERLSEAVKMVRRGPQFGAVEVVTRFQSMSCFRARRAEIDQVLVNLISNAVQAMEGKGHLTLATGCEGDVMTVAISDTGCGIPKALVKKIFDPFFTTKEPGKGTGLGLSIVYQIVNKYGGKISVESTEGRGTTFTIQFPVTGHQEEGRDGDSDASGRGQEAGARSGGG